ncbi:MAG: hypothetical protein LBJ41_09430 [Treponema sp.]|jgi:hypothetical protein|nr:hypothetical protein [Treponema sp.]
MAMGETIFDIFYLITVITLGFLFLRRSSGNRQTLLFGIMALVLGFGDAFHLIPRVYALWNGGTSAHPVSIGIGKLITSITVTVFYVLLYHVWQQGAKNSRPLLITVYALAAARIALCLFPQNQWLVSEQPLSWSIYRNLPFFALGIIMITLFLAEARSRTRPAFRFIGLAIALSFGFYLPVVLFADQYPWVGALMIPKTCAYLWVLFIGRTTARQTGNDVDVDMLSHAR